MSRFGKKLRQTWKALGMEIKEHKSSFFVYVVLRALVIMMMVLQIFNRNFENVFMCILTLLLLVVPSFLQMEFRVELPTTLEIIILLFIFAAEILGEIRSFYFKIPIWDTLLHTMNGFLAAAIGFSLVNLLNRSKKFIFRLSPHFMALVAFCFSMTIGVIWEFFEFGMDMFFHMDMQKDTIINGYVDIGLIDTMEDLFVNFIGAVIFSIIGFFYVKSRGKNKLAEKFIPSVKTEDADFLTQVEEEDEKNKQP